jgi:hypothetical protein
MKSLFTRLVPRVALLILFALSPGSSLTKAQFLDQGALTGIVQDASGAAIPGAEVTLTNPETSFTQTTQSNASGVYVFSPIKIGTYAVTVKAQAFEQITQNNIALHPVMLPLHESEPAASFQHQYGMRFPVVSSNPAHLPAWQKHR